MSEVLYGEPGGSWALVRVAPRVIPPMTLTVDSSGAPVRLTYVGTLTDAVALAVGRLDSPAPQAALAAILGVSQQSVSRYLAGRVPELPDAALSALAGLVCVEGRT